PILADYDMNVDLKLVGSIMTEYGLARPGRRLPNLIRVNTPADLVNRHFTATRRPGRPGRQRVERADASTSGACRRHVTHPACPQERLLICAAADTGLRGRIRRC
ncbi:MAG TPA: hypothetical protein VKG81_04470, partial [Mycobacterium sp.]|nr:hypothetical protein [Mycobacterium sp.]